MNIRINDIALKKGVLVNDRYRIEDYLSFGNTTIMYLSKDTGTGKKVVLKELCPFGLVNRDLDGRTLVIQHHIHKTAFEPIKKSFICETEILKMLSDKKYGLYGKVPAYLNDFKENDTLYIVMEYLKGADLKQRIFEGECLNFRKISKELVDIVNKLHKAGVLHRDIKLTNIFIRDDGETALLDFGSACMRSQEKEGMKYASSGYSAPELYEEGESTVYADIYSIGAVMYEMLTGMIPKRADLRKESPLKDVADCVNIPWPLAWWIMKALELNPQKRAKSLLWIKLLL